MRQERDDFLRRLRVMREACDEPILVNTTDKDHSERAKQLRNGLCVMAFSALEDFVRERVALVLDQIAPAALPFSLLPASLQTAATLTAIKSLAYQAQYFEEHQRLPALVREFKKLATALDNHYSISRYAFAYSGSNVHSSEIAVLLEAFNVEKPWETIFRTAQRLQIALPNNSKQEFEQLAQVRHNAAHQQAFNIPNIDLKARIDSAISIGISFDIVLSCAVKKLNGSMARFRSLQALKANEIEVYSLSSQAKNGWFHLRKEGQVKPVRRDRDFQAIRAAGMERLRSSIGVFVVQDASGKPQAWYCRESGD